MRLKAATLEFVAKCCYERPDAAAPCTVVASSMGNKTH